MKTFKIAAAQGEIHIRKIKGEVPKGTKLQPENGKYIIGHSETGHHHVLEHGDGVSITVIDRPPEGMKILHAILKEPNKLVHLRGYDTHEPIMLEPGEYEFRLSREYSPFAEIQRQID